MKPKCEKAPSNHYPRASTPIFSVPTLLLVLTFLIPLAIAAAIIAGILFFAPAIQDCLECSDVPSEMR